MKQLNDVLDSYVNKNFDKAKEVWEKDEKVDDLTYIAMESVIDFLSKDKKNLYDCNSDTLNGSGCTCFTKNRVFSPRKVN